MGLPILVSDPIPQFGSLAELRTKLHLDGCRRCTLGFQPEINGCCVSRGTFFSKKMIIGEAPGKWEDSLQSPFTGPAGQLMDKIWTAAGMNTNHWYITNVVKCRPYLPKGSGKENFTPRIEQQKTCRPYLDQEIAILQPKVVVLLGKVAVDNVLPELKKQTMGSLRGKWHVKNGTKYFIMLHPAAILHAQSQPELELQYKEQTWDDIQNLKRELELEGLV